MDLRSEIFALEKQLKEKKEQLFLSRLTKIVVFSGDDPGDIDEKKQYAAINDAIEKCINNVKIIVDAEEKTWSIHYSHTTDSFDESSYLDEQIEDVQPPIKKTTKVSMGRMLIGKTYKYFMKGFACFSVYRNGTDELRIINKEYEYDLDLDDQRALIEKYSEDMNIPEWFAIRIFLFMAKNKWDDEGMINHFSIV